jgi:hypothetical protein
MMYANRFLLLLAIAMVSAGGTHAAPAQKLRPINECQTKPDLSAFYGQLRKVVAARDAKALLAMTSSTVESGFGSENGRAAFARDWDLADGAKSSVWTSLDFILKLGCSATATSATIPWLWDNMPEAGEFETVFVVAGAHVPVYASPSLSAPVIATLSWDVIRPPESATTLEYWVYVTLTDGRHGHLHTDTLYYANYGLRLKAEKQKTGWVITALVQGD